MRITYIADARSPIARNWVKHFIEHGDSVTIISSYPCARDSYPGAQLIELPLAFSGLSRIGHAGAASDQSSRPSLSSLLASFRSGARSMIVRDIRNWLTSIDLHRHIGTARHLIVKSEPDLVHAMRIPFEGILAARAVPSTIPLVTSVWGNDFTLHASRNALVAHLTRLTLRRTNGLHCDCQRDAHLARAWGYASSKAAIVLPGAGGIQRSTFYPGKPDITIYSRLAISIDAPVVINPRGFRDYVRNDCFFQAIPFVLRHFPDATFICIGMKGNPVAEKWIHELDIGSSVLLLPIVERSEMAELFRLAHIAVSASLHDGTPNTLLEAMACGSFPVAGSIESIREWINDGVNGLLCDPNDPKSIAESILRSIKDPTLRNKASQYNLRMIDEHAEYRNVMSRAEEFYTRVIR